MSNHKNKRKSLKNLPDEDGQMDMSSMIDIVFLLLLFFVVNATALTVKKDKAVTMPVASNGGDVKSANGCIVINIYDENKPVEANGKGGKGPGIFWGTDEGTPLNSEAEIRDYITKKAEEFKRQNYDLSLYIRGDVNGLYRHTKVAIKAAGQAGVSNVMFANEPSR